jgi:methionyl-tRNA formyltransferase
LSEVELTTIRVEGAGPVYDGVMAACQKHGLTVVNDSSASLFVLANVQRIVPAAEFMAPPLGTLCFHPSVLPRHRGRDAVYWTIKMGDTTTGVSWFWVSEKVDAGDVAIQRAIATPPNISPRDLYNLYLAQLGVDTFDELIGQIRGGTIPRTVQDESLATFELGRPPKPAVP